MDRRAPGVTPTDPDCAPRTCLASDARVIGRVSMLMRDRDFEAEKSLTVGAGYWLSCPCGIGVLTSNAALKLTGCGERTWPAGAPAIARSLGQWLPEHGPAGNRHSVLEMTARAKAAARRPTSGW